jgi:hypothetical protein
MAKKTGRGGGKGTGKRQPLQSAKKGDFSDLRQIKSPSPYHKAVMARRRYYRCNLCGGFARTKEGLDYHQYPPSGQKKPCQFPRKPIFEKVTFYCGRDFYDKAKKETRPCMREYQTKKALTQHIRDFHKKAEQKQRDLVDLAKTYGWTKKSGPPPHGKKKGEKAITGDRYGPCGFRKPNGKYCTRTFATYDDPGTDSLFEHRRVGHLSKKERQALRSEEKANRCTYRSTRGKNKGNRCVLEEGHAKAHTYAVKTEAQKAMEAKKKKPGKCGYKSTRGKNKGKVCALMEGHSPPHVYE